MLTCNKCGGELLNSPFTGGGMVTCVGYISPFGHNHDDNCHTMEYICTCGNTVTISTRNRCHAPGCDWMGRETCFCHPGPKLDEYPKVRSATVEEYAEWTRNSNKRWEGKMDQPIKLKEIPIVCTGEFTGTWSLVNNVEDKE